MSFSSKVDRPVELLVGARPRVAVGAPAVELGGVPEALRPPCGRSAPRRRARAAAARTRGPCRRSSATPRTARGARAGLLLGPGPRMALEVGHQRLQLLEQLPAARHREGADDADRGQRAVVVVEPEHQRADRVRPALVHPVAGDDAVRGALVLDLEHDPLVRLVGARSAAWRRPRPARRPRTRSNHRCGDRRDPSSPASRGSAGRASASASTSSCAALRERPAGESSSPSASRSKAMNDAGVCSASMRHPRRGGVDALLQRLEVQPALAPR